MAITGGAISSIGEAGQALINPIVSTWWALVRALPGIIVAVILLIIGYVISVVLGHAVRIVLEKLGVDKQLQKAKLSKAIGTTNISTILGEITKWAVFVVYFLPEIAGQLNLGVLSALLVRFAVWLPNVIASVVVLLVGIMLAHFVKMKVEEHSKMKGSVLVGRLVKGAIIVLSAIVSLSQLGIEVSLLSNLVLIVIGSLAVGLALALGIGLGLGLKKEGEQIINEIKKSI